MSKPLSARQKQIMAFIQQHVEAHGYPPTVREIGIAVNLSSSSTVHAHLKSLEEQGQILREAVLTRAIKVVQASEAPDRARGKTVVNVPIVGTVAAGKPRLAMEDVEDVFPLPQDFATGESFMLQVKGDSMIEDGIHEGDYVVVRRQQSADNGETVVAIVYDEASGAPEATVKRFYKERARIRLQPANKRMKPMHYPDVQIAGKVVGLVRRMA